MKKITFIATLAAFVLAMTSCSEEQKKDLAKTNFLKTCTGGLKNVDEKIAKDYCECSADLIFAKYSMDEFAELEKKIQSGEADMQEFAKVFAPCAEEMSKKLMEANSGQPAK